MTIVKKNANCFRLAAEIFFKKYFEGYFSTENVKNIEITKYSVESAVKFA
jgi:hypothetical protein